MTEDIAAAFRRAATEDFSGRVASPSPLYEHLSQKIADDPELLELAATAREEQPAPLLLLAAVQYLLAQQPEAELATYYPHIGVETRSIDEETYPAFKRFCGAHESAIGDLLETRRVQTNTVRRSACLLPAFEYVSQAADRSPLELVEIGPSAGLNLLWDEYSYSYRGSDDESIQDDTEAAIHLGTEESPVEIDCELRADIEPPLPEALPPVGSRQGIDLHPLDITKESNAEWLTALIWPEHETRRDNVSNAVDIAAENPPTLHEGDVLEVLENVIQNLPADQPVCLYNTYVLYQLSDADRAALYDLIAEIGADRDIYWLSCEWAMDIAYPEITLYRWENGVHSADLLARFQGHGSWLHWLQRG